MQVLHSVRKQEFLLPLGGNFDRQSAVALFELRHTCLEYFTAPVDIEGEGPELLSDRLVHLRPLIVLPDCGFALLFQTFETLLLCGHSRFLLRDDRGPITRSNSERREYRADTHQTDFQGPFAFLQLPQPSIGFVECRHPGGQRICLLPLGTYLRPFLHHGGFGRSDAFGPRTFPFVFSVFFGMYLLQEGVDTSLDARHFQLLLPGLLLDGSHVPGHTVDGLVYENPVGETVDDLFLLAVRGSQKLLVLVFREYEVVVNLFFGDAQLFEHVAVGRIYSGLYHGLAAEGQNNRRRPLTRERTFHYEFFTRGCIGQHSAQGTLLGSVVDDLFGAYFPQGAARQNESNSFDQGALARAVRALAFVVAVVTEDKGRYPLRKRIFHLPERAQVPGFDLI